MVCVGTVYLQADYRSTWQDTFYRASEHYFCIVDVYKRQLLYDAKTVKKVYLDGTRGKQIADRYNGRHVILGIRPEDIYEFDEAKKLGIENDSVDVDEPVVNREMLGAEVILYFDEQGKTLAVRLSPENQTQVGEKVSLYFDMEKAHAVSYTHLNELSERQTQQTLITKQ